MVTTKDPVPWIGGEPWYLAGISRLVRDSSEWTNGCPQPIYGCRFPVTRSRVTRGAQRGGLGSRFRGAFQTRTIHAAAATATSAPIPTSSKVDGTEFPPGPPVPDTSTDT